MSKLKEVLKSHTIFNNEPQIIPGLDIKIRWNSIYDMLFSVVRIKNSLISMCVKEADLKEFTLEDGDWDVIEAFLKILRPFKQATVDLCGEKKTDGSKLHLILSIIGKHIDSLKKDASYNLFKDGFDAMGLKFDKYWKEIEEYSLICHVLDPRFKTDFVNISSKLNAMEKLTSKFNDLKENSTQIHEPSPLETNLSLIDAMLNENSMFDTNIDEIKKFYQLPRIDMTVDPVLWWKNNQKNYPTISKISLEYVGMMPTSVSSERSFSVSNRTVTKLRSRLKPETVKRLMAIYSWNRFESI